MKTLSFVIPVYNGEPFLEEVLSALNDSITDKYEVIIVDDASTDKSLEIARKFPFKIHRNQKREGAAKSRNTGASLASGEYLVFLDADVVISKEVIKRIEELLNKEPKPLVLQGFYALPSGKVNTVSDYKHMWIYYTYSRLPNRIYWVYACLMVIRKDLFENSGGFDPTLSSYDGTDDAEFGIRLSNLGIKIRLVKDLLGEHRKRYNLFSFLKNDFIRGRAWTKMVLKDKLVKLTLKNKGFLNLRFSFLLSVLFSWALLISLLFSRKVALFAFFSYFLLQFPFLKFLLEQRGLIFCIKGFLIGFIDHLVCGLASLAGIFSFLISDILKLK